jgi:hypothetical protein
MPTYDRKAEFFININKLLCVCTFETSVRCEGIVNMIKMIFLLLRRVSLVQHRAMLNYSGP